MASSATDMFTDRLLDASDVAQELAEHDLPLAERARRKRAMTLMEAQSCKAEEAEIQVEAQALHPGGAEDFIELYTEYADVLEVPKMMHSVVATQLVASILNRNGVVVHNGAVPISMDLWVVLLSGSGHGRTTLTNQVWSVLKRAKQEDLVRNSEWGSEPAFMQDMAEHPSGLFVWGELSKTLKQLNDKRFRGVKEWITDVYDNFRIPDARCYRSTNSGNDTPPIEFSVAPRTNILATSSEDWFFNNLQQTDSTGGFVPRWLLVRSKGATKDVPTPPPLDEVKANQLAHLLGRISELRGPADITEIVPLYEAWYGPVKRRFEAQSNQGLAGAFFNRHRGHILKLAVIYEVASSYQLRVSEVSWFRAVETAAELEETIFSVLTTGMNAYGYALKKMEEFVRAKGAKGVSKSDLTRAFQSVPPHERGGHLKTLLDSDTIRSVPNLTAGRTATIFIHREFH